MKKFRSYRPIQQRAKELRKEMTSAEAKLWARLRNRGVLGAKFRRQHPLDRFIVDFYCIEHRLAIEVDGEIHKWQSEQDAERTAWLECLGCRVLRFQNNEIENDLESVLDRIQDAIRS